MARTLNDKGLAVLGIDPGLTTGWAVVTPVGHLGHGQLEPRHVEQTLDRLIRHLNRDGYELHVALEVLPRTTIRGEYEDELRQVEITIADLLSIYEEGVPIHPVQPGAWKPSAAARTADIDVVKGRHARDAYRMATYQLQQLEKEETDG